MAELAKTAFVILLRDGDDAEGLARLLDDVRIPESASRAVFAAAPIRGIDFFAHEDHQADLDQWWGQTIPPDATPVYLCADEPGLEEWIAGVDGRFYVGLPSPDAATRYVGDGATTFVAKSVLDFATAVMQDFSDGDSPLFDRGEALRMAALSSDFPLDFDADYPQGDDQGGGFTPAAPVAAGGGFTPRAPAMPNAQGPAPSYNAPPPRGASAQAASTEPLPPHPFDLITAALEKAGAQPAMVAGPGPMGSGSGPSYAPSPFASPTPAPFSSSNNGGDSRGGGSAGAPPGSSPFFPGSSPGVGPSSTPAPSQTSNAMGVPPAFTSAPLPLTPGGAGMPQGPKGGYNPDPSPFGGMSDGSDPGYAVSPPAGGYSGSGFPASAPAAPPASAPSGGGRGGGLAAAVSMPKVALPSFFVKGKKGPSAMDNRDLARLMLDRAPTICVMGSRKGGVGKTSYSAAVAIVAGTVLDSVGHRAAIVDANIANPDAWGQMNLPPGAASVREVVAALMVNREPPDPVYSTTPALACYPESRQTSEYSKTDIDRLADYLKRRYSFIVVDMSNRLPDAMAGPEAAAAAYWMEHADVLVLPTTSSIQDFNGVLDYLDVPNLPPTVVPYIVPKQKRNREHERTQNYITTISQRVHEVVEIPDEADQVRFAGMEGVPVEQVSPRLKVAYRHLTEVVVGSPRRVRP